MKIITLSGIVICIMLFNSSMAMTADNRAAIATSVISTAAVGTVLALENRSSSSENHCSSYRAGTVSDNASSMCLSDEDEIKMNVTINHASSSPTTGDIIICLQPRCAPMTVENFLNYISIGFYNNTIFHRVVADSAASSLLYVDQGGGYKYQNNEYVYQQADARPITMESTNQTHLSNIAGTIAMARGLLPDSAQAEYYFNAYNNLKLNYQGESDTDPGYAVFGYVLDQSSLSLLQQINAVPTNSTHQDSKGNTLTNLPNNLVTVNSVSIIHT